MKLLKLILLVFLLSSLAAVEVEHVPGIPSGYVLDVTSDCEKSSSAAELRIVSDLYVSYDVTCDHGDHEIGELKGNDVSVAVELKYNQSSRTGGDGICYFVSKANSGHYQVYLSLQWGFDLAHRSALRTYALTISCAQNDYKETQSSATNITETQVAPQVIQTYMGGNMTEDVTLTLQDVFGNAITADVPLDKKVKLYAEASDSNIFISVLDCDISDGASTYNILRSGCGDGLVFPSTSGFFTTGHTAVSPFFSMVQITSSPSIFFECNFIKCHDNCDGSSCVPRQKRDLSSYQGRLLNGSTTVHFVSFPRKVQESETSGYEIVESPTIQIGPLSRKAKKTVEGKRLGKTSKIVLINGEISPKMEASAHVRLQGTMSDYQMERIACLLLLFIFGLVFLSLVLNFGTFSLQITKALGYRAWK